MKHDPLDSLSELSLEQLQGEAQALREKLNRFRLALGRHFVDKQALVDLMLVAAVAQEPLLLVGPPVETSSGEVDADALLREALRTEKASQAAAQVAKATGLDHKTLYARAMELRAE